MAKIQLFSLVFNILIPASVLQDVFPEEEAEFNPLDRFRFENVDFSLADAVESDVIFKYYSDAYQINPRILTIGSVSGHMDKEAKTVYMIHGYTQDDTDPWFRPLKRELFIQRQFNIVYINWVKAGNKSYDVSSANINPVGKFIADFIVASEVPPGLIHIIGHSLGAHLAGFVGKYVFAMTGKKIDRISGLDPAGPKFDYPVAPSQNRLCDTDAKFVDIIHTDMQGYGYTPPLGHIDFYPNNGTDQPGCPKQHFKVRCHHARASFLFVESLTNRVKAVEAKYKEGPYFKITIKRKKKPKKVTFGYYVSRKARGVYYLKTNGAQPFLTKCWNDLIEW